MIEREPWLKEHLHGKASVTELEILHGVLNDPKMAGHAFFYFRDPKYVETLSADDKRNFTAENAKDADKLRNLKGKIRQSKFPVRENYPNPKALGELVLADLTKVINDTWPEGSQPDPLDREAMDHEAYAQSRERVYIGRQEYFDRLNAHATASDTNPLVILGESGSGKSALLANWVARYRQAYPDALVLQHYIGATSYSADWAAMLRRLMGEFKRRLGLQQDIPDQADALRSAFPNWLYMAATKGRVVLVLDALNQLEDRNGAPDLVWLPPVLPENVRLIVSTLPGRPLDEIQKRHWSTLKVELLSVDERRKLIAEYLAQHAKRLNATRVERIAAAPPSANPLYLRVLLDELRLVRTHEELEERIGDYLKAESPYALYEKVIARWEQDYEGDSDLVGDTLSLLWAARRGLTETELLQALGEDGKPMPRAKWSPLFLAMSDALISRGGLLTFAHDFMRTAIENAYLPTEQNQQRTHLRLADYFERQPASPRRIDELPWQLAKAREWQRLKKLLVDRDVFTEVWNRNSFEVQVYWTQIESNSKIRMVESYREQIERPDVESQKSYLIHVSACLQRSGHSEEALRICSALIGYYSDRALSPQEISELIIISNNRASILQMRGDLDGAMEVYKENAKLSFSGVDIRSMSLCNLATILLTRGDLDGAMTFLKEAEKICRECGNLNGLPTILGNQSKILYTRGDLDGALPLLKEAEGISRQLGKLDSLSDVIGTQAMILRARGDLARAMALHKEQVQVCRQSGNLQGLQVALGNQAVSLYSRGDLDGAMALHMEEEQICQQLGDRGSLAGSYGNQALILDDRGDLAGAMTLLKKEENICRELGILGGLQRSLGNQAGILCSRGDTTKALALFKEQERICRQLGKLDSLYISLGNQAEVLKTRGDLDGATKLHKEGESICRKLGDLNGLSKMLDNQAVILRIRGDLDGATNLHKESEQICRRIGNLKGLQATLLNQGTVLYMRGDLDGAMQLCQEAERICRKLGQVDGLNEALGVKGVILQNQGKFDEAMLLFQESERICRQTENSHGLARSFGNQSVILKARGDLDGAQSLQKEAEQIYRQVGNLVGLQSLLGYEAEVLKARGDLEGTITLYKEKEGICRKLGMLDELQDSLIARASILQDRGDLDGAMPLLKEAERICRQLGKLDDLSRTLGAQALILKDRDDLDGAMALFKDTEGICRKTGNLGRLSTMLHCQVLLLQARGQLHSGLQLLEEFARICRDLGDMGRLSHALGLQAWILQEDGNLDGAIALHKEAVQICRRLGDIEALVLALMGHASVLLLMGREEERLVIVKEAHHLAASQGYTELVEAIEPTLKPMSYAAQTEAVAQGSEPSDTISPANNSEQVVNVKSTAHGWVRPAIIIIVLFVAGVFILLRWYWGWVVGVPLLILGTFILTMRLLLLKGFTRLVACPRCGRPVLQWGQSSLACPYCKHQETP